MSYFFLLLSLLLMICCEACCSKSDKEPPLVLLGVLVVLLLALWLASIFFPPVHCDEGRSEDYDGPDDFSPRATIGFGPREEMEVTRKDDDDH